MAVPRSIVIATVVPASGGSGRYNLTNEQDDRGKTPGDEAPRRKRSRSSGRLLDLKAAEAYSGISAWTLRDLIASGDLPVVRPPRLRRVWIDRADLDRAIAEWKERSL